MDKINGTNEEIKGYILRKSRNWVNGRIGIWIKGGRMSSVLVDLSGTKYTRGTVQNKGKMFIWTRFHIMVEYIWMGSSLFFTA